MVIGFRRFAACLVFAVVNGLATGHAASASEGTLIDRVWAGHPVGFALLAQQGRVFVAYYDADRQITVASRAPGAHEWTKVKPEGVWNEVHKRKSNVVGWDSHNSLVLALDRTGALHLVGNLHSDPLVYYRTARPFDVTSFERLDRMTGDREAHCTYPVFFKNQVGDFFFRYRDGSSGKGSDLYNVYDDVTLTWRHLLDTPLHDGEGHRSAYALNPILGPDGRFHVLWMWRDTPDAATNHTLSYARSADLRHWEDAHGRPLTLPLTLGKGDIVDAAKPGEGLINTTYTLGFDRTHRPVPIYHRYDKNGHSQIFAARPTADGWEQRALTSWDFKWEFGGGGSIVAEVYLQPARNGSDGSVLVPFSSHAVKSGVLRINPDKLVVLETLPPDPAPLPPELLRVTSSYPGMQVHTQVARDGDTTYVLRWETLSTNRDQPRAEPPPPSELRIFEMTGADSSPRGR